MRFREKKDFYIKEGCLFPSTANGGQRLSPTTNGLTAAEQRMFNLG